MFLLSENVDDQSLARGYPVMTSRASQPLPAYSICLAARSHGQDGV